MTEAGKGKHHISDFLPPEELEKFVETVKAVKEDRPPGTCFHTEGGREGGREGGSHFVSDLIVPLYRLFRLQGAQVDPGEYWV